MKPIKLYMQAFGAYKDLTVIDFSKLYSSKLFLITGDTGSGKSTIFDAISFALYGEGSIGESRRNSKSFRSHYANDSLETYVTLEFSHKGVNYKITRKPEQTRLKKSGSGLTSIKASCEFTNLDTLEVITNLKECDEAIFDLIGLTKNQFAQTCMIAQNDFMQILNSKSEDRKKLFQKIFNTQIYANFQESLKNKYSECEQNHKLITSNIINEYNKLALNSNYLNNSNNLNNLDLINEIKLNINSYANCSKVIDLLKEFVELSSDKINSLNDDVTLLNNEVIKLNNEINVISENNKRINSYNLLNSNLNKLLENENTINELDKKTKLAINLTLLTNLLNEKTNLENDVNSKTKLIESLNNKLKEELVNKVNLEAQMKEEKIKFDSLDKLKDINVNYNNLIKEVLIKNRLVLENNSLEISINKLNDLICNNTLKLNDLKTKYYNNQVSYVAGMLKENTPCPVCGSTNHPNVAKHQSVDVNLDAISDFEDLINKDKKNLSVSQTNYINNEKRISDINDLIISYNLSLDISSNELKQLINKNITYINDVSNSYKMLESKLSSSSITINSSSESIKIYSDIIKNGNIRIKAIDDEVNDSLRKLNITFDEYLENRLSLNEINKNNKVISDYHNSLSNIKGQLDSLRKLINNFEVIDLDSYNKRLSDLNSEIKTKRVALDEMNKSYSINSSCLNSLDKLNKDLNKLNDYFVIVNDLYKTVSGQVLSKGKIQFETFVQQFYFKQVINEANKRLSELTHGLFILRLKEDVTSKRSQGGLDLECLDNQTGKWRDVSTLSGGESFMASLSLALGLSDVVSSKSGQVRIEAMFIDEGFGTLDDNSLNQATNILARLAQTDRLIGIISHVSELKNTVDAKIIVKKTQTGSVCEIKY